jgi:hypothetical protein
MRTGKVNNAHRETLSRAGKHKHTTANTNTCIQICFSLNFLVNYQLKWFEQREKEDKQIAGLISLFMNVTIPDTHGTSVTEVLQISSNNDL